MKYPHFAPEGYEVLDEFLQRQNPSMVFFLVDSNTAQHLPAVAQQLAHLPGDFEILEVDPGEESKSLEVAAGLWQTLLEYGADRQSLLISLGGGVVGDLGGFVASTFLRGISFVQIPTSLLAMVDASVGGKTGINFGGLKNQIGTFTHADFVLIDPEFLATLPAEEWSSGHGEMVKHALISGEGWPEMLWKNRAGLQLVDLRTSIQTKWNVVQDDFKEAGKRKWLNLGHTFGHAWESFQLARGTAITHGAAVLQGLHMTLELSELDEVRQSLSERYPWEPVPEEFWDSLWSLMLGDKKNHNGEVRFVLLKDVGQPVADQVIDRETYESALESLNAGGERCPKY